MAKQRKPIVLENKWGFVKSALRTAQLMQVQMI